MSSVTHTVSTRYCGTGSVGNQGRIQKFAKGGDSRSLPLPLFSPFPFSSPTPPLRSSALKPARGSGERCKFPQWVPGAEPRPKTNLMHSKGRFTLTRTIRANNSRERSRSSFGLSIHTHANANVRANCSREQFASFALSNAIHARNLRIKPIFY